MGTNEGAGRTALVTGASAGIGTALARVFAEKGFGLVLTSRREVRLREIADAIAKEHGVPTEVIAADLSDPSAPSRIFEETTKRGIRVDALVNNAGYGVPRRFRQ